jgi:hypothetical protein
MKTRIGFLAAFAVLSLLAARVANAQACSSPYYVEQSFPTNAPEETRWKLCWQVIDGPSLVITSAWFRPAPASPWIQLIYDARLSQLFVPYHQGSTRFHDVTLGFPSASLGATDCPAPATIIGTKQETCKEVRDRGLVWENWGSSRRGQELVLWSILHAANYNYIIEWTFRDDGAVVGRVGATGQISGGDAHMHGPVWRLDLDLNGSCCDGADLFQHSESGLQGSDSHPAITTENGWQWNSNAFTMLEIHDQALKNSNQKQSEWDLMPTVAGIPFHWENWTKSTFWVTRYHWNEMLADDLMTYTNPPEGVSNSDIVVWYYAGLHHVTRDEDLNMTHLMWVGFVLKPFNVWAKTPLFP